MKNDRQPAALLDPVVALVLLTRLPMPHLPAMAFERGARAVWAYPLAGAVVGCLGCLGGLAALALGLPPMVAALVTLAVMVLATGALHEDGLADVADGFWGGHDADQRLKIMKDSQIGTYGTLILIFATGLRWSSLAVLLPVMPSAVIASAMLSRAAMPLLMRYQRPARSSGLSRSVGRPTLLPVVTGLALSCAASVFLIGTLAFPALVVCLLMAAGLGALAQSKIKGQTGDVLGATQQVTELAVLGVCVSQLQ